MNGDQPEPDIKPAGETRQRRRRPRRPLMIDNTVPSPCLSVCRFDGEPYCVGCYRNVDEIREWIIMTREQKLEVLGKLERRKQAAGVA
ncbi:MAG: DUF1289 domain-containing protein [Gammaproteobacteria bacterium]